MGEGSDGYWPDIDDNRDSDWMPSSRSSYLSREIDVMLRIPYEEHVTQTAKASLYRIQGRNVWLPHSRTTDENGILTMPSWLYRNAILDL